MKVETIGPGVCPEWDAFVAEREHGTVYHTLSWRDVAREAFRSETHYLMARADDGRASGILPLMRLRSLLFGDFLVSLPYVNYGGPLSTGADADEALLSHAVRLARDLGVSHIELRESGERSPEWPSRTDKVAMVLDLPASRDALFKDVGSKLRAQIRRPEKEGASARLGGAELLPDFYAVFARNMRDLGTPVYPYRFFEAVCRRLDARVALVVVHLDEQPVAAALLIGHGGTVEIPWASSIRAFNRVGVNMLLYWEALGFAIDNGFRRFDFGRSTRDSGTYRFKKQWGAHPVQLFWHYWLKDGQPMPALSPANPKYRMAIRLWQALPVPVANIIGPRLVKHLP